MDQTTTPNTKTAVLFIRISDAEKSEIAEVVASQPGDVTVSQFVRDAAREKIAAIKKSAQADTRTPV